MRALLREQVQAYQEQQGTRIEEKRAAIDKMFEGQSQKPTGPQLEDRTFELPMEWAEAEEPKELEVKAVAYVSALEPQKLMVKNTARVRTPMENVRVSMQARGAKATFEIKPNPEKLTPWSTDSVIQKELQSIVIREVPATAVLRGEALFASQEEGPEKQEGKET